MTTSAPERVWSTDAPPPRFRAATTAAVVIGVVVALLLGLQAWQRWATRAPYGPEAVRAHVTMRLVPEAQVQAALDSLTGTPDSMRAAYGFGPLLVGQVVYDVPPSARESDFLTLFVLDAQSGLPLRTWGATPGGTGVGNGWDSSYYQLGPQVPWLAGIPQNADHSSPGEQAVSWGAQVPGPITFQAVPPEGMLDPAALSSYTVGLTMQNDGRTLLWAQQLTPNAP